MLHFFRSLDSSSGIRDLSIKERSLQTIQLDHKRKGEQ